MERPHEVDLGASIGTGEDLVVDLPVLLGLEDGEEVEANLALWQELYAINRDADEAWAGLLTALLRDPDFLLY